MSRSARVLLLVFAAAALVAAGCGGDDDGGDGAPANDTGAEQAPPPDATTTERAAESVTVALDEFSFDPQDLEVDRGATIEARNVGDVVHNLTIEQGTTPREPSEELAATPTFQPDEEETLTVDLEPGSYSLVCTVPGHREAGMVGSITVR